MGRAAQLGLQRIADERENLSVWARLMHRQSDSVYEDAMIAATALVNGLTVVTRNMRDFQRFQLRLLNPFDDHRALDERIRE